jgi:hypothetical protein
MAPLAGSVLTKRNVWAEAGVEARAANCSGPDLLTLRRPCATVFRFVVMGGFLLLSACATAPVPEQRASVPAQRNLSNMAPTPCTIPNAGQTDAPTVLNSRQPSEIDRLKMECLRGVPPPWTNWFGPTREPSPGNALGRTEANRYSEAERFRQEMQDFQRRQRSGR